MGYTVGTWAASPMELDAGKTHGSGQTLREIVHVSVSGDDFTAVTLSNEFGHEPLVIGSATLAHRVSGGATDAPIALTFAGKPGTVIAPGARIFSDHVRFRFPPQSDVAVSLYIPAQPMTAVTGHAFANGTNYIATGDQTRSLQLNGAMTTDSWRYLVELDVSTATRRSIVCFGDSITDGSKSTKDANRRWPDLLAARLQTTSGNNVAVLNEGIGGNRILHDGTGPSAIVRFERDALDTRGYPSNGRRYIILLEGINDIGRAYRPGSPPDRLERPAGDDLVNADDLIAGYRYLAARAHANGLKIFGATLTPYLGAGYASMEGEKVRQTLNQWIRTTSDLDGVIDFDRAVRDPAHPGMMLATYDSGDHLHPNDAGMKAMADSIDLCLFKR